MGNRFLFYLMRLLQQNMLINGYSVTLRNGMHLNEFLQTHQTLIKHIYLDDDCNFPDWNWDKLLLNTIPSCEIEANYLENVKGRKFFHDWLFNPMTTQSHNYAGAASDKITKKLFVFSSHLLHKSTIQFVEMVKEV